MTPEEKVLEFMAKIIKNTKWNNKIFLCGGAVRDEILNIPPKDLDFVVDGDINAGIEFSIWLSKYLGNYKVNSNPVIYPRFGTAKLSLQYNKYNLPNIDLEFVAPRQEQYTAGSRKPNVKNGNMYDEVMRRDQTINSLLKNVSTGKIIDLSGKGLDDIKNKIIRTTSNPDVIFKDDPLRMLRVIRATVKLGFEMSPDIIPSIKKNSGLIDTISKERIQDELNKILVSPSPAQGIELLRETNLLKYVLGSKFMSLIGMTQNKHHIDDAYNHTLKVLQGTPPDLKTRLMALFHDIGKSMTRTVDDNGDVHFYEHEKRGGALVKDIMKDLKYSNEMIDSVVKGVESHMQLKQGRDDATQISNKLLRKFSLSMGNELDRVLDLIHADNSSHSDESSMPNQVNAVRDRLKTLNTDVKAKVILPIDGNDLINMGLKPGPIFREIMDAVQDAWFENPDLTRDEAMNIAKQIMLDKNINEIKRIMKAQI